MEILSAEDVLVTWFEANARILRRPPHPQRHEIATRIVQKWFDTQISVSALLEQQANLQQEDDLQTGHIPESKRVLDCLLVAFGSPASIQPTCEEIQGSLEPLP
jgi:hypothetical protein